LGRRQTVSVSQCCCKHLSKDLGKMSKGSSHHWTAVSDALGLKNAVLTDFGSSIFEN
jgi:hypothetical protein